VRRALERAKAEPKKQVRTSFDTCLLSCACDLSTIFPHVTCLMHGLLILFPSPFSHLQTGKKLMFRSAPPKAPKRVATAGSMSSYDNGEEHQYFFGAD
jgi:hypothetical protein